MIQDLIAVYKLKTNLSLQEVEDICAIVKGVRSLATFELAGGEVSLEVHMHGQTEPEVAEVVAQRVMSIFQRMNRDVEQIDYLGITGTEDPTPEIEWAGRDPFDEVVVKKDGHVWVRADYYIHAVSFNDLGVRDENTEMMMVHAWQRWPQRGPAREAIRRIRSNFTFMRDVRALAGIAEPEEFPPPPIPDSGPGNPDSGPGNGDPPLLEPKGRGKAEKQETEGSAAGAEPEPVAA